MQPNVQPRVESCPHTQATFSQLAYMDITLNAKTEEWTSTTPFEVVGQMFHGAAEDSQRFIAKVCVDMFLYVYSVRSQFMKSVAKTRWWLR